MSGLAGDRVVVKENQSALHSSASWQRVHPGPAEGGMCARHSASPSSNFFLDSSVIIVNILFKFG